MQRLLLLCAVGFVSLMAQMSNPDAQAALNRGVQAFKAGQYAAATTAFQEAIRLAPGGVNPRLYLATTYMSQWIPGSTAPGNEDLAVKAEDMFQQVLNLDSRNTVALTSLASLAFNQGKGTLSAARMRHFDEAERWYKNLLDAQSTDKIALYSLGVIAWERYYPELMNARAKLGMKPETPGPLPDPALRADLRSRFGRIVEDGISSLKRAIEVDPQYDDAMAYLNLLYRERADYSHSAADYSLDIQRADELVTQALEARRRKQEAGTGPASLAPPPPPPPGNQRIRVGGRN